MRTSASHKEGRLPKRFPVGTTYVVEGRGGPDGQLRVCSRYVVLPDGQRINLGGDFAAPASPRNRRVRRLSRRETPSAQAKRRTGRSKKIIAAAGTTRSRHR
jgi:hypothetical protein